MRLERDRGLLLVLRVTSRVTTSEWLLSPVELHSTVHSILARLMGSLELTTERAKLAPVKGSDSTDDPFRNLPNELLSRIFVLCCNSPLRVLDVRLEVPHQQTISQVCSRWRQVALSTGVLWSNVHVEKFHANHPYYPHSLRVYQMWVGRAGDYPLTISIYYSSSHPGFRKVFLDFIVPIRIKKLDIRLPFLRLVNLPSLSVEEFTIADIVFLQADEDLKASQFMKKTRRIHIRSLLTPPEECEPELKELFLSWHQLRSFECDSRSVSLSAWLNVLGQSGTVQYLEWCHLTIANAGSGPLVGVCMPNLHWLSLKLLDVQPDIVIPLITVPNITTLEISFQNDWESSDAYDVIKRHYNLRQLHQIRFWGAGFPVRIAQILADAPMIHTLGLQCEPILDTEAREGIASGRLGRCLTTLYMNTGLRAGEWLDMIETRQKNVKSMVMKASNWQEIFTGIKSVEIWDSPWSADCDYQERVTTLNALGTTLEFVHQPIPWSYT